MSHAETKQALESFKTSTFTNGNGQQYTAAQIYSKLSSLADKERVARKNIELETRNQAQLAEIEKLKAQLEGKSAKKSA
jgi:hypothetical protein